MPRRRTSIRPAAPRLPSVNARALTSALAAVVLTACSDREPTVPARIQDLPGAASAAIDQRGKPTRFNVPDAFQTFTAPAGVACSFAVGAEPVVNRLVTTTFPADKNGDVLQLTTGTLVERYTNLETGKSITVTISGPRPVHDPSRRLRHARSHRRLELDRLSS